MHFGKKTDLNAHNDLEEKKTQASSPVDGNGVSAFVRRTWKSADKKAKAVGAVVLSAALALGMVPIIAPSDMLPESQGAQVAKVSFEGKTKAEVEEMMKHMTIDEIVDAMPLRDKVSQMFVTYTDDLNNSTTGGSGLQAVNATVKNNLATYPVGGVCYFRTNLTGGQAKSKKMSDDFQANNKYGMLIAVDEEGGAVQRIGGSNTKKYTTAGHSNPPGALTAFYRQWEAIPGVGVGTELLHMYAYENEGTATAYSNAKALAENCKLIGANWDYAPVVDVDLKSGNAIAQAGRTYSKDVDLAADLTTSAVKGFNDAGVACSAKHFPGHGSVAGDTHNGFVDQTKNLAELEATDLKVYKEILSDPTAELDSIMFGHMSTSNVDGASNIPASVSKYWVDYIRNELNFDGVVLTDGMRMDGLKNFFGGTDEGYVKATVAAFDAGIDMFLLAGLPLTGITTLESHIKSDTTGAAMESLDDSVRRIMTLKRKYNIIPAQEDNAEATYISSNGNMEHGTFAAMWSKASAETIQSGKPAPVVRLNKDVTANSHGSFGTGANIAANGDLTLTANHSVTVDLNGFTLNKNLTGSSSANGKHVFNIPANATITIHDSSSSQNGKITGANGDAGTVAYAAGSNAKFIIDSGTITGNAGTSLIYADASAVLRLGIQDNDGNNAGPISVIGNDASYAVDFSGSMYLMGETAINNNGGANLYFNGTGSIVNVQDRGLAGGNASIGVTVSNERADNVDLFKPAGGIVLTGSDLNALFYDDDNYQLELDTNIKLVKTEGDVRFVSSDGSVTNSGTWDDMWALSQTKDGTLTVLKDLDISYTTATAADNKYVNKKNTTIQLNGKKLVVSANNGRFINNESGTLVIADKGVSNKKEEKVAQASNDASLNRDSRSLTYYEDRLNGSVLETYKVVEDLSTVGMIHFSTTNTYAGNPEADGIIQNSGGTVNLSGGILTSEHARGITAKANTTVNMTGGYVVGCNSWGHASGIWAFGANATANISGGVIAVNVNNNTTSGSSGAVGAYSSAKAKISGGIFTGNISNNHGGAITTGIPTSAGKQDNTTLSVSGGTICHNTTKKNGGGIYVNSSTETSISNVLVSNNVAQSGAGIYMNDTSKVALSGNVAIMSNNAVDSAGGIYSGVSNALSIKDNIIVKDNTAANTKSDIAVVTNGNKISVRGAITSSSRSIGIDLPNAAPGNVFAIGNGYTPQVSDAGKFFIDSDETLFGSLDSSNNIYLEEGEAQYVSLDGNIENGDLRTLWTKYFAAGASGTITLMKDVALTNDSQLMLESTASSAKLDLNGKDLSLANSRTDNESPICVPSGSFEITDSSARATTVKNAVAAPAGTRALLSQDSNQLTYYTTEHEQGEFVTYKNETNLSNIGHVEYTGGSSPNGIVHVGKAGTFTLTNGLLTCPNGRAILNGSPTEVGTPKVNINGGYIAGCTGGLASVLLAQRGATTNINGGVIAGNTNPTGRGTIWMNSVGNNILNMTGGIISGNYAKGGSAEQGGGAILVEYANTSASITGGLITHNSTDANGGGICYATAAPASGLNISNVVVSANKSSMNGGGIYSGRNIIDPGCYIDANEAKGQGGAIYTTASLVADTLCTSGNKATQSGGIFTALGITMRGAINIEGNTAAGIDSNLDIRHLTPGKVQITGALDPSSRIGVSFSKTGERNQKIVSSTITLNDSYSKMFSDDASSAHILRFNDGTDGMYVINEDVDGKELGEQSAGGGMVSTGAVTQITAKNTADNNGKSVAIFTGNGTSTIQQLSSLNSSHRYWLHYKFVPETHDGQIYYKLTEIVPADGVDATHNYILKKGEISIIAHGAGDLKGILPIDVGQYAKLSFDAFSGNAHMAYPSAVGNFEVFNYDEGPAQVNYKIHYLYHYPVSEVMTGEYYIEDPTRTVEKTGVVGQVAYVPYEELQVENYLPNDVHNIVSKTLADDAPSGTSDWYYKDDSFQGMHGSADSINDLYVIYEHLDTVYTYNVEYYDYETDELIKTDENLSAMSLPIVATAAMKNSVYEYFYKEHADTIDTITEVAEGEVPSLRLYFKKYPSYSIRYIDSDSGDMISQKTATAAPGTEITLTDADKVLDGYDFIRASADSITLSEDGGEVIDLVFEKILYNDYYIDYYDTAEYSSQADIKPVATVAIPAKAGTTVELQEDQQEIIASNGKKYRMRDGFEANVLSGVVPRSGEPLRLSVWTDYIETSYVYIYRYEWNGAAWTRMNWEPVECDANTVFDVLSSNEMRLKYVDRPGYVLTSNPKNVTRVEVGSPSDPTPHIYLYYAKLGNNDSIQKTPNDNGLVPIERTSTKDFINIELFDYGRSINDAASSTGQTPIFKGYPLTSVLEKRSQIGNLGETVQYDALTAVAGDKLGYNTTSSGLINRLAASSVDDNRKQGANAAVNGLTYDYVGGRQTTPTKNPMSNVLGADGNPMLANGDSLGVFFTDANDVSPDDKYDFTVKQIATGIDGLFEYNSDTGYYSYSSVKNHAEYNADTNQFDVYEQIITPNVADYSFGNFLPFTNINDKATRVTDINHEYMMRIQKYAQYKSDTEIDAELKKQYSVLANSVSKADAFMVSARGADYDYEDIYELYYADNNSNNIPNNAINPQDAFYNPITKEKYFESYDDFYNKLYMIDYDEIKNFFFGITFDFDFVQPQNGQIGENRTDMIFDFEGDDDVLIYIDGKLFLNLAGIHRQVSGQINFADGTITYRDYNYNEGITKNASYASQPGYSSLDKGVVTFREALRDAGMSEDEINSALNEDGTFKDWTSHSFKMFYMERGSGSGVLRLNFNMPIITNNTLLVAKNITNENPDYQPILSDPFFNMQLVKCDESGHAIINPSTKLAVPYLPEGTEYMIYDDGIYTGRTRTVDKNGIITLRSNQFAVISNFAKPDDIYCVRELIDASFVEQFDKTTVTNNTIFENNSSASITHTSTSVEPANSVWYENDKGEMINYLIRSSYAMKTDGTTLSSTLFENNLNLAQLGALAITKDIVEGDEAWNEDDEFFFSVTLDGRPVPATTSTGEPTTYYVYEKKYDADGKLVIDGAGVKHQMEHNGIVSIKAHEVAVLRYMLAGSEYEICEVNNPDAGGSYHPVYDKDDAGNNIYSGKIPVGSVDEPVEFGISNQRAENLVISKVVENAAEGVDSDYNFRVSIAADDRHIDDTYEYEIVNINTDVNANVCELPDLDATLSTHSKFLESGHTMSVTDVRPARDTLRFADGQAYVGDKDYITLKANQKIIIYGLPYQCSYTVSEITDDEYEAFYKGMNESEFKNGNTAVYVLDSKSNNAEHSNTVEFKNRKVENLTVSKTVDVGVIDALLGKYDKDFEMKFKFSINNAKYMDAPLNGKYNAEVTDSYHKTDGVDTVTATSIEFLDGNATFELSHGQTIVIHGLPYGTSYDLLEENHPAFTTSYKVEAGGETTPHDGCAAEGNLLNGPQKFSYVNVLIKTALPTTGGIGLVVIALAVAGGIILFAANRRRKQLAVVAKNNERKLDQIIESMK